MSILNLLGKEAPKKKPEDVIDARKEPIPARDGAEYGPVLPPDAALPAPVTPGDSAHIEALELGRGITKGLVNAGVHTVGELRSRADSLREIKGIGPSAEKKILEALESYPIAPTLYIGFVHGPIPDRLESYRILDGSRLLTEINIDEALSTFLPEKRLLIDLTECPDSVAVAALRWAKEHGATTIVNGKTI